MGKGSSQPQPTSTSQTSIPEYAKPYVERLLGKAEAASQTPYQTYGGQRLTEATPEQQAARASVAGMGPAQQFGTATGLATQAGQAGLAAGQYQPGVFAAPLTEAQRLRQYQAAGPAGVQTGLGSFTGAGTAEQFMSPYMQNVVGVQQREAIRAAQQGQLGANLMAARQGTYGGARQLLAQTERERNLQDQLGRIQATGSQAAYDAAQKAFEAEQARGLQAGLQTQQLGTQTGLENLRARLGVQQLGAQQSLESQRANQQALLEAQRMAEQSRQFGGTLGLQGAQAATQASQVLGGLGTQQQAAGLDLARAQEQFGGLGQREKQAALDLAYQDFIRQQQYPYAQLGFMSDILRGSANLAQTGSRAMYETPPSTGAQLLGLASTLGGAYLGGGGRFAEGGEVKGLSGIKGFAEGGEVSDVVKDMADVDKLTPDQIKSMRQSKVRPDVPDFVLLAQLDKKLEQIESAKTQGLPQTTVAEDIRAQAIQESAPAGLDAIPIPDDYYRSEDEVAQMAGGGIVAFANGGKADKDVVGGLRYPDGSVGYIIPGLVAAGQAAATVGPQIPRAVSLYRALGVGDKALLGSVGAAGRGALGIGKAAVRNPITTTGALGGLGYMGYDYMTGEPEPDKKKEEAAAAPPPKEEPKQPKAEVSDRTVKKIERAEDAYEKALRKELDKTDLSGDDKMQALGFALMKFGAKAMKGRKGREFEAYGEGIEAAADDYVNTLKQAKKDRRELTKTLAEYGLAKERIGVQREQVEATLASGLMSREAALAGKMLSSQQAREKLMADILSDYRKDATLSNPKSPTFIPPQIYLQRELRTLGIAGGAPPSAAQAQGRTATAADFYKR